MTLANQKEMFSIAFVRAVAAAAGYKVSREETDDDSVDIEIAATGPLGSVRSPKLHIQLKCTAKGILRGNVLSHQIPMKNYDDLRWDDYQIPRVIVVVTVPKDAAAWLEQNDERLALCHCGYWASLRGKPAVASNAKDPRVTIHLPRSQPFTVEQLTELMAKIGRGEKP